MKKVFQKMWLDVICVIVGVVGVTLLNLKNEASMILTVIFAVLFMINLLHNLNNRKYITNFLCNLFMIFNLFLMSNSVYYLLNDSLNMLDYVELLNYCYSYVLVILVLGNIFDLLLQRISIKKKEIEYNLNTKNNRYLLLINLVNIFLVLTFVLEENLLTSSVLFMFVGYLILIVPIVYYFKRKHYICGTTLTLDLIANYGILIGYTVAFFSDKSASINQLLMVPLFGTILIPLSILPIICIKYKKEHLTN